MASTVRTTREQWGLNVEQGQFLRSVTINTARQVLAQEQARDAFPREREAYVTRVDGQRGKPEERVRFGGNIVYSQDEEVMAEAIAWIYNKLVSVSPIGLYGSWKRYPPAWRKEHYSDLHQALTERRSILKHDGLYHIVAADIRQELLGGTIIFTNPMPYARRIEHGAGEDTRFHGLRGKERRAAKRKAIKRTLWSSQSPRGVYRAVAQMARAKFGKTMTISYQRIQLAGLGYRFRHRGVDVSQFYPALLVTPR